MKQLWLICNKPLTAVQRLLTMCGPECLAVIIHRDHKMGCSKYFNTKKIVLILLMDMLWYWFIDLSLWRHINFLKSSPKLFFRQRCKNLQRTLFILSRLFLSVCLYIYIYICLCVCMVLSQFDRFVQIGPNTYVEEVFQIKDWIKQGEKIDKRN